MAIEEDRPEGGQATGRRTRRRTRERTNGGGRSAGSKKLPNITRYTPEDLLAALRELEAGDFSVRLAEVGEDVEIEIAQAFNRVAALNEAMSDELGRVSRTVG